jgi:rod shape-determining protein MreB
MPVNTPTGNLVVDVGGGTSEAAVISMNGIVEFSSVRVGGNRIDETIMSYVKRKYNLMIGEQSAEEVKIQIGSALPLEEDLEMEIRGRDQVTGLPKTIRVTSAEVTEAISEPLTAIVGVVKAVLEKTPPELAADVIDRGIVMTGGGALLRNFDRLLTKATGVPCYVADNPIAAVALGAGKALENYEVIRRSLPSY